MTQRIICGDNLEVLKKIPSESVDLCYIDPPFFSGRKYSVIFGDEEELRQFDDRWVKMAEKGKYSKDINVYLNWMEPRIEQIKRTLKKTGTFYLHCDKHAVHYLKIICDKIFGYNRFIDEIIWHYSGTGRPSKKYKSKHDNILFYSKSTKYTFNVETIPVKPKSIAKYSKVDEHGKRYKEYNKPDGTVKRSYMKPQPIDDVWNIPIINVMAKERMGYPTQKPETLLKRIINISSNEGDVVLDAFCGCGTTLAVANKLKRDFIGIDVSPTACRLMADRIGWTNDMIEGMPLNAKEVESLSGWEFQNWINREFGAVNGKKGADGGIDGDYGGVPIQVKKYRAGRPDLDNFSGVLLREGKKEGIYIAISYTSTFIKEVNRLDRDNGVTIHYFTPEDILAKKHESLLFEIDNV